MIEYLSISKETRSKGSYYRNTYRGDTIYTFYEYKEFQVVYSKSSFSITDSKIEELLEEKIIDLDTYSQYMKALMMFFSDFKHLDSMCIEEIYDELVNIRLKYYDNDFIVNDEDVLIDGLNQSDILEEVINTKNNILYIVEDESDRPALNDILDRINNKSKFELRYRDNTLNINRLEYDEIIQNIIDNDDCVLLCAGQGAFLALRDLKIDSFILGKADTYITKAFVNQRKGRHLLYVPKGFDITNYVFLTTKSILTFTQLYYLNKEYGLDIYKDIDGLFNKYPKYFDNIYQNDNRFIRDIDLSKYHYQKIEESMGEEDSLLMHTIKVNKPFDISILENMKQENIRDLLSGSKETYFISNFLFFTTSKLITTYNNQRKDRPDEMIDESFNCHLDYKKDGIFESISLYNKAIFGINNKDEIEFFKLYKMSGYVKVNEEKYYFDKNSFNTEDNLDLIIYTPYYSINDEDDDNYIKEVGHNRFNVIMLQDKVVCAKRSGVLLPCVGYVLSFKEEINIDSIEIHLNETEDIKLAYGGGMMLIDKGEDFSLDSLIDEGWLSPLSKLSQDTAIEKPSKHPRTAIGKLKDGSLIVCVFDGRNKYSLGATYNQMCKLVRKVYPDVEYLMNIDGGASSVLSICSDGVLKEISYPATSIGNVAGMIRNVSTLLMIKVD